MIVVGLFQPVLFCSILTFPVGRGTFGRMSREASIPSYIPANLAALISCSHYVSFVCICTLINQILDSFLGINPNARGKKKSYFLKVQEILHVCVLYSRLCWQVWVSEGCDGNWIWKAGFSSHFEFPSQNSYAVGLLSDYRNMCRQRWGVL